MNKLLCIAIDGPAGAGKSTVAKMVAKELGFVYIDTGAMYRTIGLHMLRNGIAADDKEAVIAELPNIEISLIGGTEDSPQKVFLGKEDVSAEIRREEVGNMASACSVIAEVRRKLVEMQQQIAATTSVVMDGRDIGTVVLKDAILKIYLTATVEVRAERRVKELLAKGENADAAAIARDIAERDERDMTRAESPLRQAEDAVYLDTSYMSASDAANKISALYREAIEEL